MNICLHLHKINPGIIHKNLVKMITEARISGIDRDWCGGNSSRCVP